MFYGISVVVGARLPPEEYRRVLHQGAEDEEDAGQHPGLDRSQTLEKKGLHNIIQGDTRVVHNREGGNSQLATNRLRVLRGGGEEGEKMDRGNSWKSGCGRWLAGDAAIHYYV